MSGPAAWAEAPADRDRARDRDRERDRGSVLILALVFIIVAGILVVGLLGWVAHVLRIKPPLEDRNAGFESLRSGVRMAITMQREVGPEDCFASTFTQQIDGRTVTVRCTTLDTVVTGLGRYGLVSTANVPVVPGRGNISGATAPAATKVVEGAFFVNAGSLSERTGDLQPQPPPGRAHVTASSHEALPDQPSTRYLTSPAAGPSATADPLACTDPAAFEPHVGFASAGDLTVECATVPWTALVGDDDGSGHRYPRLPQVPSFRRPGGQVTIGSCTVYFPGRYDGATPLVLDGGQHYFASGVYNFNQPIVVRGGAEVVMGEGRYRGCAFDAEATFSPAAPRSHEITGKGVTLILGDDASVTVEDASLRMNQRIATRPTRGSDGISIISVNGPTSPPEVSVPPSIVRGPDEVDIDVTAHQIRPTQGQPAVKYVPSTLAHDEAAVRVDLSGGAGHHVLIEGYVFVPNAMVQVSSGAASDYGLRLNGGVVASAIHLDLARPPATPADPFQIGVVSEVVKRKVRLTATTSIDGTGRSSTAIFEVHRDGSYAINSWTLDG